MESFWILGLEKGYREEDNRQKDLVANVLLDLDRKRNNLLQNVSESLTLVVYKIIIF